MSEINNENELNESNEASDKDVVNAVVEPKVDSLKTKTRKKNQQ